MTKYLRSVITEEVDKRATEEANKGRALFLEKRHPIQLANTKVTKHTLTPRFQRKTYENCIAQNYESCE